MTVTSWRLESLATRLLIQQLIQTNNNKNINLPHYWSLWRESTTTCGFPHKRISYPESVSMSGGFSSQRASKAESISMPWHQHNVDKKPAILQTIYQKYFLWRILCTSIQISLKFVLKDTIDNKSALVLVITKSQMGIKSLSEPTELND